MVNYVHNCPIWGEPHEAAGFLRPETRTYEVSRSARAGNGYKIDEGPLKLLRTVSGA